MIRQSFKQSRQNGGRGVIWFLSKKNQLTIDLHLRENIQEIWKSLYLCKNTMRFKWNLRESRGRPVSTRKTTMKNHQYFIKIFWKFSDFKKFRLLETFFYFVSNKNKLAVFLFFFQKKSSSIFGVWSDAESTYFSDIVPQIQFCDSNWYQPV